MSSSPLWDDGDIALLKEKYYILTADELLSLFPNRTIVGIRKKALKMGMYVPHEMEFINRSEARKREKCPNWNGGKRKTRKGYVQLLLPEHPRADRNGYVMEHIVIWERYSGAPVPNNCVIHHLNGIKNDNRIDNLCLMTRGGHSSFHNHQRNKERKQ